MAFGRKKAELERQNASLKQQLQLAAARQATASPMQRPEVSWSNSQQTLYVKYTPPAAAPVAVQPPAAQVVMQQPAAATPLLVQPPAAQVVMQQPAAATPMLVQQPSTVYGNTMTLPAPTQYPMSQFQMPPNAYQPNSYCQVNGNRDTYHHGGQTGEFAMVPMMSTTVGGACFPPTCCAHVCKCKCNRSSGRKCRCGRPCICSDSN